ncbi:MAG: hypothetical protein WKF92_09155 [Pyrinomonadaceae bacterium]
MKIITVLSIAGISLLAGVAGACSSDTAPSNTAGTNRAATTANTAAANTAAPAKADDETPALIKAALPDAQSFTTQHKDIPKEAITDIEKDTGAKVPDTDHHSYLAFSTAGGKRTQVGAATVVKAAGKDIVIIYDSKDGSPAIREVRAEGVSPEFLKQFAGKGHDDMFSVGNDIKVAVGVDDATAKAIAQAVRIDSMSMQTLYGSAHAH